MRVFVIVNVELPAFGLDGGFFLQGQDHGVDDFVGEFGGDEELGELVAFYQLVPEDDVLCQALVDIDAGDAGELFGLF